MRHGCRVVTVMLGVSLLSVGCATKGFVREEIGKTETKLGQEVGRLDSDLGQEKTRVSGLAVQVTETRSAADEAARRADQAGTVAGEALAKAGETDSRLSRLWNNRNRLEPGDTVLISFGFDKWQLDDRAETTLLDVVSELQANPNLMVQLEGYTDNVGAGPYNIQLSQRRAEAVRRFLVEKGIELQRIHSIGLGDARPVADNKTRQGRDQNRRVAVKVLTPMD